MLATSIKQSDNRLSIKSVLLKSLSGLNIGHIMRRSWQTKLAVILVIASIVSCYFTYVAMTSSESIRENRELVFWLLNTGLVLLLLLISLIARRIVSVWSGRKRGIAGSHLHIRFVYIFSLLVAVPTIIMTVFSALFFHYGIQAWFSQRVQTAINESQAVAQSYLEEHKEVIRSDTMAMANDLNRQADFLLLNSENLSKALDTQTFFRNLSEAIVMTSNGKILGRSSLTFTLEYETPRAYDFAQADAGDVVLTMAVDDLYRTGKATAHDVVVGKALAHVLSGGNTDMTETLSEDQVLGLERKAIVNLMKTTATLARMEHMLETGKPLRN